jgi:5-methylcytosine-specific restriction endonuclease McrA
VTSAPAAAEIDQRGAARLPASEPGTAGRRDGDLRGLRSRAVQAVGQNVVRIGVALGVVILKAERDAAVQALERAASMCNPQHAVGHLVEQRHAAAGCVHTRLKERPAYEDVGRIARNHKSSVLIAFALVDRHPADVAARYAAPSFEIQLPSVVSLKSFVRPTTHPAFIRFNVFLRDRFVCQYCSADDDLTFDHILPRSKGGQSTWENVVAACSPCNLRKGNLTPQQARMFPRQAPFAPTVHQLHRNGRLFPPNYLHDSWLDYLYWDTELEP